MEEKIVPEGILCAKTHEWVLEKDDCCIFGLTDWAVEQLGDVVFVELPEIGAKFAKNEVFSTIESVKAASEIYAPIGCEVVEINEELLSAPEIINEDNWEKGWLIKVKPTNFSADSAGLMEYDDYKEEIE